MGKNRAIVMKEKDNVATAVEELAPGTEIVLDAWGKKTVVCLADKIPFGHKFALRTIAAEEKVVKYGETIGAAIREIQAGQHVHVHNMVGCRGRGDLAGPARSGH